MPKHLGVKTDVTLENITKVEKKKTANVVFYLMDALKNHFVFYNLSETQLEKIVNKMFYCEVKANDYVFK